MDNGSIWEQNLAALRLRYPQIAELLKEDQEEEYAVCFGTEEVCGKNVLFSVKEEKIFQLDSLYDTDGFLDIWYETIPKLRYKAKLFMFGLGNGMYVRKLLASTTEDVTIHVYEPKPYALRFLLETFDMTDILSDTRVKLFMKLRDGQKIEELLSDFLEFADLEGMIYRNYLNYRVLFEEEYKEYINAMAMVYNAVYSTQSVIDRYGQIYYENTLANLPYFMRGKSLLDLYIRLPKDIPAIIVAAGPSLDKNILELKAAKGKAFIIAVDTALRPLLRSGIVPDLCVSIDGKKMTEHFYQEGAEKIPLVTYLLTKHEILTIHKADKYFVNDLNHHIQHFLSGRNKLLPVISSGGSVANDAFSIAQVLGFTTIILVGQDLAYTDNKTHSSATVRGEMNLNVHDYNTLMVEGIDGEQILSSNEFILYINWFETQIEGMPYLKVIDATQGGAKIHGTIIQDLKKTISEECTKEVDIQGIMAQVGDFFTQDERAAFREYVLDMPNNLEECRRQAVKGLRAYEKLLELVHKDKYNKKELNRLYDTAADAGNYLDKAPVMDYVRNKIQTATSYLLLNIYEVKEDKREELLEICGKGRDYLKLMIQEIDSILKDLKVRREEFEAM